MKPVVLGAVSGVVAVLAVSVHAASGQSAAPAAGETVVGVSVRGTHRAYPAGVFAVKPVINDEIGGMEVVVFYDVERGLSAAWFRMVRGETIEFSGMAVGAVADDLTTVTRWDLSNGKAVGGNLVGQQLVGLPVATSSWAGWKAAHPDSQVYGQQR